MKWYENKNIIYSLLCILVLIVYSNTFGHIYNLDDNYILNLLSKNDLKILDCFKVFNKRFDGGDYRPIGVFILALERFIFGDLNPNISHIVNVIIFFLGVCFMYNVLIKLDLGIIQNEKFAFICCILFIAHPIHSNVVSSIKNRDILLSFLFSFSSLYFFLKYLYITKANRLKIAYLSLSIFLLLLAQLSKRDSIWVFFAITSLYFINKYKPNVFNRLNILKVGLLPLVIFLIIYISQEILKSNVEVYNFNTGNKMLYTENPIPYKGFLDKIYYVVVTIFMYVKFFIVPAGYYFYFGHKQIFPPHILQPYFIFGIVIIILLIQLLYKSYKLKHRAIIYSLIYIAISIAYCLNIVQPVSGIVDPRLAYHASVGYCMLLSILILNVSKKEISEKLTDEKKTHLVENKKMAFITIVILIIYIPITINRNKDWKNIQSLMDSDIPHLTYSFQANRIAAYHYLTLAKTEQNEQLRKDFFIKGLNCSNDAISIDPNNLSTQEGKGIAYNYLGIEDSAISQFKYIIKKFDTSEVAWDMLGDIYYNQNKKEKAAWYYKNTIRVSPLYDRVYYKYTVAMLESGKKDSAKLYLSEIINKKPNWYVPYDNMGYLYLIENDTLSSVKYYISAYKYGLNDLQLYNHINQFLLRNNKKELVDELRNAIN